MNPQFGLWREFEPVKLLLKIGGLHVGELPDAAAFECVCGDGLPAIGWNETGRRFQNVGFARRAGELQCKAAVGIGGHPRDNRSGGEHRQYGHAARDRSVGVGDNESVVCAAVICDIGERQVGGVRTGDANSVGEVRSVLLPLISYRCCTNNRRTERRAIAV